MPTLETYCFLFCRDDDHDHDHHLEDHHHHEKLFQLPSVNDCYSNVDNDYNDYMDGGA